MAAATGGQFAPRVPLGKETWYSPSPRRETVNPDPWKIEPSPLIPPPSRAKSFESLPSQLIRVGHRAKAALEDVGPGERVVAHVGALDGGVVA